MHLQYLIRYDKDYSKSMTLTTETDVYPIDIKTFLEDVLSVEDYIIQLLNKNTNKYEFDNLERFDELKHTYLNAFTYAKLRNDLISNYGIS